MIAIETYYSNITFSAEGCKDLHGTLIHYDNAPDEIETCWKLEKCLNTNAKSVLKQFVLLRCEPLHTSIPAGTANMSAVHRSGLQSQTWI